MYLIVEFFPINTSFVENISIWNQCSFKPQIPQANRKVRIFSGMNFSKTTRGFKCFFRNPHIETAGLKPPRFLIPTLIPTLVKKEIIILLIAFCIMEKESLGIMG